MDSELNGQYCHLCKNKIARPEAYCGSIYICDDCARKQMIIDDTKCNPTDESGGKK